jgi:16S rRNA (guanine966-N2)-methyltransferase
MCPGAYFCRQNMSGKKSSYHEFRVIAGFLKGRLIKSPDLGVTRPPLTRLRKAIFDFLNPYIDGSRYLDLFSGTGSYLFEAVSRGAETAVGVELEPTLADAINKQAEKYGVSDTLVCRCDDVFKTIPKLAAQKSKFDVIMIAPPQYQHLIDRTLAVLGEHDILARDGIILCQHDTSESSGIEFFGWKMIQRRKYGNTTFTILGGR